MPPPSPEIPMTPEEAVRGFMGGRKYGAEALADKVANGHIPEAEIRLIIGVDENGNPIYRTPPVTDDNLIPLQALNPLGGRKHRP